VYPTSLGLVRALRERGIPAAISGAGPSVIAFAVGDAAGIAAVIAGLAGAEYRVEVLAVPESGVRVL
jgi:homoserine kinase